MYENDISAWFDAPQRREELLSALTRLVAVKSVKGEPAEGAPYGPGPRAALDEGLRLCAELGFTVRDYDHRVGLADLNDKPTGLHILGHLDVVGEGTGWDTDPYTCVERDGMLYGRGVSDDKGPVCAALLAMEAVKELNIPLKYNVRAILGSDEECGSSDVAYYYAREPFTPCAFTPDAEFPLINVEKGQYFPDFGRSWAPSAAVPRISALTGGSRHNVVPPEAQAHIVGLKSADVAPLCAPIEAATGARLTLTDAGDGCDIHCLGRNAHAATPTDGVNAICALLEMLCKLPLADCGSADAVRALHALFPFGDTEGKALGIAMADAESGALTLNFAMTTLTETGFTGKFDARVPVSATEQNCRQVVEAAFAQYGMAVTGDGAMAPAHCVPADTPLVKTLLSCYETYTGERDARPIAIGGGTYVHDIPGGVAFGCQFPGFDPKMHSANEQEPVDGLLRSAKIFALAIARLCGA